MTSRFGAPIPVTKTSAFSRSHKAEMKNFLSRKKWAMPGARYPGTVLAAQKSVTRRSDDFRSRRTRSRRVAEHGEREAAVGRARLRRDRGRRRAAVRRSRATLRLLALILLLLRLRDGRFEGEY